MSELHHIAAYAVPPDADAAFLAGWDAAADAVLHRALLSDAAFRFVAVAAGGGDAVGASLPDPTHAADYDLVHEDGRPDVRGGVVAIGAFDVPEEDDVEFLGAWRRLCEALALRHGYLGAGLYRGAGAAVLGVVEVARWSSPLMAARARREEAVLAATAAMPWSARSALYEVVGA